MKTLAVRMEQHDRNGRFVAEFLARHKKVKKSFTLASRNIRSTTWRNDR